MKPGFCHHLHSPARKILSAEWIALTPRKLHRSPLAAQLLCREFMFRPRAVELSGGGQSELS